MAVKLHRCRHVWIKLSTHPCWRVQKALDETGVEYEIVPEPRKDRTAVIRQPARAGSRRSSSRTGRGTATNRRRWCARSGPGASALPPERRYTSPSRGAIAQLGERLDRTQEVGGSSPPSSIRFDEPPAHGNLVLFRSPSSRTDGTRTGGSPCPKSPGLRALDFCGCSGG